jgi:hypothetical protein
MQTFNSLEQSKTEKVNNDPLAKVIVSMVDAMRADYGDNFKRTFTDKEQLTQLKRRLYSKLKGLDLADIMDGYDKITSEKKSFLPTIPEIVGATLHCQKERKKAERDKAEVLHLSTLPPVSVVPENVARDNLKKLREMFCDALSKADSPETMQGKAERLVRLNQSFLGHEAVMKRDFKNYGKQVIDLDHNCSVSFCGRLGTFTASTSGASNWYCKEHYFKNK